MARAGGLSPAPAPILPVEADEDVSDLPARGGRSRTWAFWLAGVAVACIAAVSAAGLLSGNGKPETLYQKTMAIAGEYRCPVCAGESAASSDAPAAVEIRHLVSKWLEEGKSQKQIRAHLVADYGPSILEKPPASGLDSLVWILPVLAVALGAGGLAFAFYRWKKAGRLVEASGAGRVEDPPLADPPVAVGEQGTLFTLTPDAPIRARGERRGALQQVRRLSMPIGVALVALAVALFFVDRSSSPELPGGTITGGATGLDSELVEAQALAAKDPVSALEIYQKILVSYPDQPIALTDEGWIYAQAGFAGEALALLGKAEKADPSYGPAHLYRGLVLLDEGKHNAGAVHELDWYLAHDPSPSLAKVARNALTEAKATT